MTGTCVGGTPPAASIRPCVQGDAEALSLLAQASFLEAFAGVIDGADVVSDFRAVHAVYAYREHLADGTVALWLFEPRGVPVGYAMSARPPDFPIDLRPTDVELRRIYLIDVVKGTNAGRSRLEAVRAHARATGGERLLFRVYRANARAIAFYRREGFTGIGERTFRVGDDAYADSVMMSSLVVEPSPRLTR